MDPAAMEPYARAMRDYYNGDLAAVMVIEREDGYRDEQSLSEYFTPPPEFSPFEKLALERCQGRILDIGAGAGRVSLALQERGLDVTAVDVAAPAVEVMRRRGVRQVALSDFFDYQGGPFDTLLLTMHGIGMVETLAGLDRFLVRAKALLAPRGQILCDSLDVRRTDKELHLGYQRRLEDEGRYVGEVRMRFEYNGLVGAPCGWLHVDQETLRARARIAGWQVEILAETPDGNYLARLTIS
jgi:SAM-dependent methyltransferase